MKRLLKIFGIILSTLILLIVIGIFILTTIINPNDFKDQISQQVKQETGMHLTLAGHISWSFFPKIGFKAKKIILTDIPGFTEKDFVNAGEVDVKVHLFPLLKKQLKIDNIAVKDAQIHWTNPKNNQTIQINNLTLTSKDIHWPQPFHAKADFDFQTTGPNTSGHINFTSKIDLNLDAKTYNLQNLKLQGYIKTPQLFNINLVTDIAADLQQQTVNAPKLNLEINNADITGALNATNILTTPVITGNMNIATFNPRKFLQTMGLNVIAPSKTALTSAAAKLNFTATPTQIKIPSLQMTLDQSQLQGAINLIDLKNKAINFNLQINKINLDNYQVKVTPITKQSLALIPTAYAAPAVKAPAPAAKSPLQQWKTKGNIAIAQLTTNKLYLSNFKTTINSANGIINLKPISAGFYSGSIYGQTKINMQRSTPSFSVILKGSKIQVEPFMQAVAKSSPITGTVNCNISIYSAGNNAKTITKNLSGKGNLSITNGIIKKVNIPYLISQAKALLNKQAIAKPKQSFTNFNSLTGTFIISKGILRNNDLLLQAPTFQVSGRGTVNLNTQGVNYKVNAASVTTVTQAGKKVQQVEPLLVPINITGTFSNLNFHPDYQYVIQNFAKRLGKKLIDSAAQSGQIPKDVGKHIGDTLKETLGIGKLFN